jgi:hypothetical protein
VSVELCLTLEELCSAATARKGAQAIFVQQLTGVSAFGALFSQDVILKFGKFFAPLLIAFFYFETHRIASLI